MTIHDIIPSIHIDEETLETLKSFQRLINGEINDEKIKNDFIRSGAIGSISSNRFSDIQVQLIKDNWVEISEQLKKLIEKFTTGVLEENDCRDFCTFLQKKSQDDDKKRDTPGARYRLLACALPGFFCPIPDTSRLNQVCEELEQLGLFSTGQWERDNWIKNSHVLCELLNKEFGDTNYPSQVAWKIYLKIEIYKKTKKMIEDIQILVENNYNLILTGAPGTGKTFLARKIAASLIRCKEKEPNGNKQFGFVQFHPSYDYTDFVEGLRPNSSGSFTRMDGIFKAFCANAAIAEIQDKGKDEKEKRKFVFVIDEINRGEISKIFGELFFSIDPGYRGEFDKDGNDNKVKTQYQNLIDRDNEKMADKNTDYPFKTGFYVPNNVYVIGTMNDIDRSVESMDFAFRRRFAFKEVFAIDTQEAILNNLDSSLKDCNLIKETAIKKMKAINDAIYSQEAGVNCNVLDGFTAAYHIGAAYFKKIEKYDGDWDKLWNYHIKGVLFEYLRGTPNASILLTQLERIYNDAK